jgi:hypothetical protein
MPTPQARCCHFWYLYVSAKARAPLHNVTAALADWEEGGRRLGGAWGRCVCGPGCKGPCGGATYAHGQQLSLPRAAAAWRATYAWRPAGLCHRFGRARQREGGRYHLRSVQHRPAPGLPGAIPVRSPPALCRCLLRCRALLHRVLSLGTGAAFRVQRSTRASRRCRATATRASRRCRAVQADCGSSGE